MRAGRVWRGIGLTVLAALAVGVTLAYTLPVPVGPDRYSVYDGDTLQVVRGHCMLTHFRLPCVPQRLRLFGVDAFERTQTCKDAAGQEWACGAVATKRLQELVDTPDFGCQVDDEFVDRHAREFAVCLASGHDVGTILVAEGLAFAYGRRTSYVAIENEAKAAHRGAWAGSFIRPQYFRAALRD